ncbi:MAG: hypothetical protein HC857_16210 [Synechococcales cyanobacterium RU_4_20]|nr:hypothetical protein [Synechococcales cyanobacterium RU_4_20]
MQAHKTQVKTMPTEKPNQKPSQTLIQKPIQRPIQKPNQNSKAYMEYHYDTVGATPGTLFIGEGAAPSELVLIEYSSDEASRRSIDISQLESSCFESGAVSWLDVQGLGSESVLQQVGDTFNLHRLILEDIVNVPQRPKVEHYDDQLLITPGWLRPTPMAEGFIMNRWALFWDTTIC